MYLADTLSRAFLTDEAQLPSAQELESVNMVVFLPIGDKRLQQIQQETQKDEQLQKLRQTVLGGWPDQKTSLDSSLLCFFSFKDEITVQDGLLFKGQRVIIPRSLRTILKTQIHTSHIGIEGCLRRAREAIYWPGMSADIKEYISTCEICGRFDSTQQPECLQSLEVPKRPWQNVSTDIFTLSGKDYLVTVDHYSNFFEVDDLKSITSAQVIQKLKRHFARYGIPDVLYSDNGRQYTSSEFSLFAKQWDIEHRTTSPYHSQGNGRAESAVKIAKRLLRKALESGSDYQLALLDYRNTPTQALDTSPAQRLMNRRTKTLLPTSAKLLQPALNENVVTKLEEKQLKQGRYFNQHAKPLAELTEGDTVRVQNQTSKLWEPGVISEKLPNRSYTVETPVGTYRRNRRHIRKAHPAISANTPAQTDTSNQIDADRISSDKGVTCEQNSETCIESGPTVTKFGRTIKPPDRLVYS